MEYKIIKLAHSSKSEIEILNNNIKFYTKNQMREIYPVRIFRVIGEIGNKTGYQIEVVKTLDGQLIPFYAINSYKNFKEKVVGYTPIDKNTYLAVVKCASPKRIAIFLIASSLMIGGLIAIINYLN